ncbi:MAG: hypothetical protein CFE45_42155 [Burkholderiales bacterium PBB5]|nr:MAG: hypothetical protein CFE45_42155 [Burkholderiales bacterium PBB5]
MSTLANPPLRLPAELTIFTASVTRNAWLGWMADESLQGNADGLCLVAADEVAEIDAAGVQLLVSLANALAGQHRRLRLQDPTEVLRKACTALGVQALLLDEGTPDPEAA